MTTFGKWARIHRAIRYATGRLTKEDARNMSWEIEQIAESHAIASIDSDGVLERMLDQVEDCPELPALCAQAAARVASDIYSAAIDWAQDIVFDYAKQEGITLKFHEGLEFL